MPCMKIWYLFCIRNFEGHNPSQHTVCSKALKIPKKLPKAEARIFNLWHLVIRRSASTLSKESTFSTLEFYCIIRTDGDILTKLGPKNLFKVKNLQFQSNLSNIQTDLWLNDRLKVDLWLRIYTLSLCRKYLLRSYPWLGCGLR